MLENVHPECPSGTVYSDGDYVGCFSSQPDGDAIDMDGLHGEPSPHSKVAANFLAMAEEPQTVYLYSCPGDNYALYNPDISVFQDPGTELQTDDPGNADGYQCVPVGFDCPRSARPRSAGGMTTRG